MTRWIRLRVRPGVAFRAGAADYQAGDDLVVSDADAAILPKDKGTGHFGTRHFEIVEVFEADCPPDGTISIEPPTH